MDETDKEVVQLLDSLWQLGSNNGFCAHLFVGPETLFEELEALNLVIEFEA